MAAILDGAVRRAIGEHDRIAVSFSGGLDSLAVLCATLRVVGNDHMDRVSVHMIRLRTDDGRSNVDEALAVLGAVSSTVTVDVVDPPSTASSPAWLPAGPRLDALPEANDLLGDSARARDATVILTGSGSDELLGTARFSFYQVLRHSPASIRSYARDTLFASRSAWGRELLLPPLARLASRKLRTWLYLVAEEPDVFEYEQSGLVSPVYREHVNAWCRRWRDSWRAFLESNAESLNYLAIVGSVFPQPQEQPIGGLDWQSPFRDQCLTETLLSVPGWQRYDGKLTHPYWRAKCLVLESLPNLPLNLPVRKDIYGVTLARRHSAGDDRRVERLVGLGLLDSYDAYLSGPTR